ncbi:hypothetical protein PVK64_15250 [Aliivibrio sp. S4TY2]|nr:MULTISPECIES: hypothetical protein [unclassified Aliivibrio]MDD9157527.1 hypothetical protein [Aliivibrio sp. S4TY2]MDD9169436.1 hypothetical protein [Aliivibrio sp. S4MY4]MDD9186429.1 hypothetical protein [Aliivibrio sp. S4MY3]MDD9203744.1 hypothetical protein [Aliivibrio sp. S4MY1]
MNKQMNRFTLRGREKVNTIITAQHLSQCRQGNEQK